MPSKLMQHQIDYLERADGREFFANFLPPGTGKTRCGLEEAKKYYDKKEIDTLVVIAPKGPHLNWVYEAKKDGFDANFLIWGIHSKDKFDSIFNRYIFDTDLLMFALNIEALSRKGFARYYLDKILDTRVAMMIVDESTSIKTIGAERTKYLKGNRDKAPIRRIFTGLPITQNPFDLFSQTEFLNKGLLGFRTYTDFKWKYGIFEKEWIVRKDEEEASNYDACVGYKNLDDLSNRIKPHCFTRSKKNCLDLPDKIYLDMFVEMCSKQKQIYRHLKKEKYVEIGDDLLLAPHQLVWIMRAQQIAGGFYPSPDPDEKGRPLPCANPKLNRLIEIISNEDSGPTVVWARFVYEIDMIVEELRKHVKDKKIGEIHGRINAEDRIRYQKEFQSGDIQVIVAQQRTGKFSYTFVPCDTVIYYSNSFSSEDRQQSEDRTHRIGSSDKVRYIDLIAVGTVDERISQVLKGAYESQQTIMGFLVS